MKTVLYINACVRQNSRTDRLARFALGRTEGRVEEVRLGELGLSPLDGALLAERTALAERGAFGDPSFALARQFAAADELVIAAPYWDLSFPALLKIYLERINVIGITFRYTADGRPESLCAAKRLTYVTTAGGPVFEPNLGFAYVRQLAEGFFAIPAVCCFKAEGLDVVGADPERLLREAEERIAAEL